MILEKSKYINRKSDLQIQRVALARILGCVDFKMRVACSKQSLLLLGPMAQELKFFSVNLVTELVPLSVDMDK